MSLNKMFWKIIFWKWEKILESSIDDISINWYWIQNEHIHTRVFSYDNIVDFQNFNLPKINGRGLLWYYQRGKKISLEITIIWDDQNDFFDRIDELRKYIFQSEIFLAWKINWVYRKIKVNCLNNNINLQNYNITFLKTSLEFETLDPYFYIENYQSNSVSWVSANITQSISNNGTAPSDTIVYIIFWTVSGTTSVSLTIGSKEIQINQTFTTSDILIINSEIKQVLLNGISIDYDWVFPNLEVNMNFLDFAINGTFSADIITLNKVNYV